MIACTALSLCAQAHAADRQVPKPDQYGRFVVTFSPFSPAGVFLVDTQAGRTWELVGYTDLEGTPKVWRQIERIDSDSDLLKWLRTQKPIDAPKK